MKTQKNKTTEETKLSDSAKKLIQPRLPFKAVTTPTTSEEIKENSNATTEIKKRKLSAQDYEVECLISDEETEKTDALETNTNVQKRLKLHVNEVAQLITADDEYIPDNDDIAEELVEHEKQTITTTTKKAPLQIKLPLCGKKTKRRKGKKSNYNADTAQSSDEMEKGNPKKRAKVDAPAKENKSDEVVELISDESDNQKNDEKLQKTKSKDEEKENNKIVIKQFFNVNNVKTAEKEKVEKIEVNNVKTDDREKVEPIEVVINDSDDSLMSSTENTETQKKNSSITNLQENTKDEPKKPLTEKKVRLKEQRRLAREEKERKLMQEKLQKQHEKEQREEAKKREREEKEEQRRKEREDKENKKREEREEKERKRLAEIEAKTEEKRKRHEAKEEELRKKDEERKRKVLEKQEAKLKVKKEAEAFTRFFVAKNEANNTQNKDELELEKESRTEAQQTLAFRPFQIKGSMKLAPITRRQLTTEDRLKVDKLFDGISIEKIEDKDNLYLQELRVGKHLPVICHKLTTGAQKETSSEFGDEEDVLVIEDELASDAQAVLVESNRPIERIRAKFYKFHENRRPPYYGTWRKRSKIITARKPFAQDEQTFDYEIDSDLEWEEEEPGESLEDSDGESKDKEAEDIDDYDVDNEWMVPHGHLSDEEMQHEEDSVKLGDENTREAQKAKLQLLQKEFAMEMTKKTKKIHPRLVGCIWVDINGKQPSSCSNLIWQTINLRAMICVEPPILAEPEKTEVEIMADPEKPKQLMITDTLSKDLIRLIHGNSHSKSFLIKEFLAFVEANEPQVRSGELLIPSKSVIRRKIEKYAEWQVTELQSQNQKKKNKKRLCWVVHNDVLLKQGMENLSLKNQWSYLLNPRKTHLQTGAEEIEATETNVVEQMENIEKNVIKSPETIVNTGKATPVKDTVKKRVPILMTVARGKDIPVADKNVLINNFLNKNDADSTETNLATESSKNEVVIIE